MAFYGVGVGPGVSSAPLGALSLYGWVFYQWGFVCSLFWMEFIGGTAV